MTNCSFHSIHSFQCVTTLSDSFLFVDYLIRKGRRGRHDNIPTVPNQPSEASAFFFFEMAKTVLQKAGGPTSISVYCSSSSRKQSPPHRGLLLCAFEIGLYALRLNNTVQPNWLSRNYSTHVSWITSELLLIVFVVKL